MAKGWFTAQKLANMKLPGLPATREGIQHRAGRERWAAPESEGTTWRQRKGRGGGIEYRWTVLPQQTREHLLQSAPDLLPKPRVRTEQAASDASIELWWAARPPPLRTLARSSDGPLIVQLLVVLLKGDRAALRDAAGWLSRLAGEGGG